MGALDPVTDLLGVNIVVFSVILGGVILCIAAIVVLGCFFRRRARVHKRWQFRLDEVKYDPERTLAQVKSSRSMVINSQSNIEELDAGRNSKAEHFAAKSAPRFVVGDLTRPESDSNFHATYDEMRWSLESDNKGLVPSPRAMSITSQKSEEVSQIL